MIARPAFGDFITAARGHVGAAAAGHQADRSGEHVQEITDASPSRQRPAEPELLVTGHFREDGGALKAALHRLGVKNPDLLQRAADIDRASEQLILEAADRSHQPAAGCQPEQPEAES